MIFELKRFQPLLPNFLKLSNESVDQSRFSACNTVMRVNLWRHNWGSKKNWKSPNHESMTAFSDLTLALNKEVRYSEKTCWSCVVCACP